MVVPPPDCTGGWGGGGGGGGGHNPLGHRSLFFQLYSVCTCVEAQSFDLKLLKLAHQRSRCHTLSGDYSTAK